MQDHLNAFEIPEDDYSVLPIGNGLINGTWKVTGTAQSFILQRINTDIFTSPQLIADNIRLLCDHLEQYFPGYLFPRPIPLRSGGDLLFAADGVYRMFRFIEGSHTIDIVQTAEEAYEAAYQFGDFTRRLSGFPVGQLHTTLPDFHNLGLRYRQFQNALREGDPQRINEAGEWIAKADEYKHISERYASIVNDPDFILRVTHHDTKISNVLFDEMGKAICVIDLDTIMPGYFISDLGDMMRTYVSPVSEESSEYDTIQPRREIYEAVIKGYTDAMGEELTGKEKQAVTYAGPFMIYMQALRFLTDHLLNDPYYGAKYEGHNLVRAGNQFTLLQRLLAFQ